MRSTALLSTLTSHRGGKRLPEKLWASYRTKELPWRGGWPGPGSCEVLPFQLVYFVTGSPRHLGDPQAARTGESASTPLPSEASLSFALNSPTSPWPTQRLSPEVAYVVPLQPEPGPSPAGMLSAEWPPWQAQQRGPARKCLKPAGKPAGTASSQRRAGKQNKSESKAAAIKGREAAA